ncbi:MAG: hypothetical protein JWL59_1358 [Chthoniobacteraceae bacterium]|nr:hypothetical protein [Chthoniobacteraceae bacterium]
MKPTRILCTCVFVLAITVCNADPALTIYNQNFAVVRDTVPLDLKAGTNDARFAGVTALVEPDSVILRDPAGKNALRVLEQNYRNDPVSEVLLLSLFEGQTLTFAKPEPQKADRIIMGKVIRSGYVPGGENIAPIIEVDGQLQFTLPGEPRFPSLGNDSQLKPALTWKIESPAAARFNAELAYVSSGFSWEASYNVVSPENGGALDLTGWITMKNESGATFTNAKVKLMAGDVGKIQPKSLPLGRAEAFAAAPEPQVSEKTFDEYHLYTLAQPTTLHDKETKQVEFSRAAGIKADRFYVYDGADIEGPVESAQQNVPDYGTSSKKKVATFREFKNSEANHLGIPLPKGRIRFYQQDTGGQLEFIGEAEIGHTPKDETVRLYVGDSFDLVGEHRRTHFAADEDNHRATESFEIKLRNRKKEPVEIRVVEHLYRWPNWAITAKSQEFEKKDAQTLEFKVPVKPGEEATVTYTVKYTW